MIAEQDQSKFHVLLQARAGDGLKFKFRVLSS